MHLVNCEHPIKIFNPYTKEEMFVKCGKCNTCRNSRAKRWVDRLNQEMLCHPYNFFVYLDYNDSHLPKYEVAYDALKNERYLFDSQHSFGDVYFEDYCIPYLELQFDDKSDYDYFDGRISHPLSIPHGSVSDLQKFFKRLNKRFHDKVSNQYSNFRYFVVQEYGPTSHRPHYHGLFFVDNQKVADSFRQIFCECWRDERQKPIGHADSQIVENAAASYVAQYLNCDTHLPSFYSHSKLRPFFLCSRQPPIGSLLQSSKEVREIFDKCAVDRVIASCRQGQNALSVVPILPSFKDRLFPKLPRFSSLSHPLRVALYGLASVEGQRFFEDFEGWKNYFLDRCFPWFIGEDGEFHRSLDFHVHSDVHKYLCFISDNFENDRPLREVFRISKRVFYQHKIFNVSLDHYVSNIERFYKNFELYKLKKFYEGQNDLLADGTIINDDLVFMYPKYVELQKSSLSIDLDISDVPDYKNMVSLHSEIMRKNTKVSKKNAYFEGKLSKTDPILFNVLKKFYYAKKRYEDAETLS